MTILICPECGHIPQGCDCPASVRRAEPLVAMSDGFEGRVPRSWSEIEQLRKRIAREQRVESWRVELNREREAAS